MNFSGALLERQRWRPWTPLITQQMRLRNVLQIVVYNLQVASKTENDDESEATGITYSYYYTLHSTSMSAPFYTSEKCEDVIYPMWEELDASVFPYSSANAFVVRIWQSCKDTKTDDVPIFAWGINLTGLVYVGPRFADVQPASFRPNTVILYMRGGYFTCYAHVRTDLPRPLPFVDHLNVVSSESDTVIFRNTLLRFPPTDIKSGYSLSKLHKIRSLQLSVRNRRLDVDALSDRISQRCSLIDEASGVSIVESESERRAKYSHLLTMTHLNKLLNEQGSGGVSTRQQRRRAVALSKSIEQARFRTRLLAQERDKLTASMRQLKQTLTRAIEENEEKSSELMERYRQLSRDKESLKDWYQELLCCQEQWSETNIQLLRRKRSMLAELAAIFPIDVVKDARYTINGVYLPDSKSLNDYSDEDLGVALGYASHVLLMLSWFLQVPLRYPIRYFGSRSHIYDHITPNLTDKERLLPLFTKGIKDRMQFNYAVYLLNKNIAQLRWLCGQHTPDLHATLPNLSSLLLCPLGEPSRRRERATRVSENDRLATSSSSTSQATSPNKRDVFNARSGRQNDILNVPEAYMSRQISHDVFAGYLVERNCLNDSTGSVEQGTDILNSELNRVDEGAESYNGTVDVVSEKPSVIVTDDGNNDEKTGYLQKWLESGPALVCSDERLYPEEILGTTESREDGEGEEEQPK